MKRDDWSGDCHRISDGRTFDWRSRRVRERQVWKEVGFWRVNMGAGLVEVLNHGSMGLME